MKVIDIYSQYFHAYRHIDADVRKAALVKLTATSEEGSITYEASVTFFPFRDPEDFAVSYDVYLSKVLYSKKGRRSRKREEALMKELYTHLDELSQQLGGQVFWAKPLREGRFG